MTPVETMALVVVLAGLVKLAVLMRSPKSWINFTSPIFKNMAVSAVVFLIIGAGSLYYLLQEVTIVQIFATMLFLMSMFWFGLSAYHKEFSGFAHTIAKDKKVLRRSWFLVLVWLALSAWVLYTLFF